MIERTNITGIILAGGKSSRIGFDKGVINLNGKPFIVHIIEAMKPLVNNIIIVSDNTDYDKFGYQIVNDLIKNFGPVAGLYSGLSNSKTEYNLVLSCDVPLIKTFILEQLIDRFDIDYDMIQLQSENKSMPLIAIYKTHCLHTFEAQLNKNEKRLRIAVEQLKHKTITIDSECDQYVKNINTIAQLNEIQHAIKY
jgi:molybdopterin-guanine dinucleotide biosynthesis protein A